MSDYAYPYDPTASNPACLVQGERYKLEDFPNKWGCIIPLFAPFYRKDLTLRHVEEDRPLYEGIDYYLGHYYEAASEENKMPIFGSVMIIDQTLSGTIEFVKYRTLGGRFNMVKRVIDNHLNQVDMPDPRNLDWEAVMRYEMAIPAMDAPENITEAIANDLPTAALDRVQKALARLNEAQKAGFDEVIVALQNLSNKVQVHDVDNHHTKRGVHKLTAEQLGALHRDDQAVNALKAYGYTLGELVTLINLLGENAEDTDSLFRLIGDSLEGRLRFQGDNAIIRNEAGTAVISIIDGTMNVATNSNIVLEADAAGLNDNVAGILGAGDNQLSVHSDTGKDHAVYNGFFLMHIGNIADYIPPPDYVDTILHSQSSATVFLSGRGISSSPFTGYVYYPEATAEDQGLFRLSHSIFSGDRSLPSSGRATHALYNLINKKVDNTVTVNGKRLNKDIVLTKEELGLPLVQNTSPSEKVASDDFMAAVADKADDTHTHTSADFSNIPMADQNTYGLVRLTSEVNERNDLAIVPAALNEPYQEKLVVENELGKMMPSMPFNIMQYGGFGYLPLPVMGSYGAAGIGSSSFVGCLEADGRLVCLRNGADQFSKGVYYWYVEFKSDGTFSKSVTTTTEYVPPFLDDGDRVANVQRGSDSVFPLSTINGKRYIVLTRNTMDMSKHVGAEIVDLNGCPITNTTLIYLYKGEVHFHYHYFGNGGCYSRHWKASVADIEAGKPITLERVSLSGDDWDGVRQDSVNDLYFTRHGQSTTLDNGKPIIHRLDNNHWNGSNNVRHSQQNTMFVIKDNKLRVLVSARTYYSRSNGSTGARLAHSYVVDLDTMELQSDNSDHFPVELRSNGWTRPPGVPYPREAWPAADPNNDTPVLITRGEMYCVRFYGTTYIPRLYKFESASGLEPFDYAEACIADPTNLGGVDFDGAYGSDVGAGVKRTGFLEGDRMFGHQTNGKGFIAEYDVNGSYTGDGKGWGPTSNRSEIPTSNVDAFLRVPMNWDTGKCEGFVISTTYKTSNSKIVNDAAAAPVTWGDTLISAVRTEFRALHPATGTQELWSDRIIVQAFGDWEAGVESLDVFVQYTYVAWADAEHSSRAVYTATHKATIVMNGNEVTGLTIGDLILKENWHNSVVAWGNTESFAQNSCGTMPDGNKVFCLNHSLYVNYVGHSGGRIMQFVQKADGSIGPVLSRNGHTHVMYSSFYHPDLGLIHTYNAHAAQSMVADIVGNSLYEIENTGDWRERVTLLATQVASGWVVYFTEESRFYVNGNEVVLPVQSIDLSTLPNYQNTTFYIYVRVSYDSIGNMTGSYDFKITKGQDNDSEMYIGYARTDDTQIVELNVERATRLGSIYELEDHSYDKRAHNDLTSLDKYSFNLGNVENMGMIHTLQLPTFREVFDTWSRISHFKDSTTQPHNPGELDTWIYDEATDTLECTVNSATFVGFVSPKSVADHVFDTLIGSPHSDNDAIVIILAFEEDADGVEHTICAVRSRSIEGHMVVEGKFDIWYDYHQPTRKLIATGGGVDNSGGWSNNFSRITSVRKGDQFTVSATSFAPSSSLEDHGKDKIELTHTFDLQQFPELQLFKSGGKFGYGCMSQPNSTFINILRPDENVGSYYASADTIRILSERQAESVKFATGIIAAGQNVPIPAGFTESDCQVLLSFHDGGGSVKLTYAKAEMVGMRADVHIREKGGSVVTNRAGSTARYYLIARKKPEV